MEWVKLKRFCELTGDTPDAVHARRRRGLWKDGIHCQVVSGVLWVNLEQVKAWIQTQGATTSPEG